MPIRLDHPEYLWLVLLALPVIWLGRRSLASLEPSRRWTAIGLRLALLLVLILMLCGMQWVRWHHDLTVVAVVDQSESVRRFGPAVEGLTIDERIREWITRNADDRRADDRLGLVTFDARPTVRVMPGPELDVYGATLEQPVDGTDTATGIRMGMAVFPSDTGRRMLLAADGNDTASDGRVDDVLAAAREAAAAGVPIDVLPIEYAVENEVMVDGVYAPPDAQEGQPVALRIVLRATAAAAGNLFVLLDGEKIELDEAQTRVETSDWTDGTMLVRQVQAPRLETGANRYDVVFEPDEGYDAMPANNRAQSFTLVQGKGKVLIIDGVGGESGSILADALTARGIETEVVDRHGVPLTLAEMQRYDAVILQNIPAEDVPPPQQAMFKTYVNDLGGGLVMIGGPDSFGAGGWTHTPIDEILPVTCELPKQTTLPVGALAMVIDESGSMTSSVGSSPYSKQQVANQSAILASRTLFPTDLLGILAFSDQGRWVRELSVYDDPKQVEEQVNSIGVGGGTNIYGPLVQAYEALAFNSGYNVAIKHIIMLTDGQGSGGDYDGLLKKMKQQGITMSTVGVGESIDSKLLERLAEDGGGTFYHIRDPKHLPQIFVKEARQVRKQLIRETPFQPMVQKTGSPIMTGIARVPPMQGMVLTGARKDPRVFMPLIGPEEEPIFAHWQVGLGRVAAFTSDAHNRWATQWLEWEGYADFWTRTMRSIARPAVNRDFDLAVAVDRDTMKIRLDTGGSGRDVKVGGSIILPDGGSQAVTLEAVAPGVFEATAPAGSEGSYIVSLFAQDGQERGYVFGGATRQAGEELRRFVSNRSLLEQVAQITGGRIFELDKVDAAALFDRENGLTRSRSIRPAWRTLLLWALILFMLDVAARRVSWDFGAMLARFRKAQQAREKVEPPKQRAPKAKPAPPKPKQKAQPKPVEKKPPPPPPKQASTPTTNRLLDAKRRAQQRLDKEDDE